MIDPCPYLLENKPLELRCCFVPMYDNPHDSESWPIILQNVCLHLLRSTRSVHTPTILNTRMKINMCYIVIKLKGFLEGKSSKMLVNMNLNNIMYMLVSVTVVSSKRGTSKRKYKRPIPLVSNTIKSVF